MNALKRSVSTKARLPNDPVTPEEYEQLFLRLWGSVPPRIALAVSGGVDSMALAHLSSTLPTVQQGKTKLHAFIVDHKARSGSSHEAQYVAETMNELKIKPHILTIDWDGKFPRSAFETIARERRYQLMARQCVQHDINRLLLGHHEDDRAETVLYRMLLFAKGEGLATMKARTKMPGTWEVFGADDLELGRPFASTPKTRLIATCQENKIRWYEDHTNADVRLTPRNAIRKLLTEIPSRLPVALQKPSLLELSDRMISMSEARFTEAQRIIDSECHLRVKPEWGSMHFRLPERRLETLDVNEQRVMMRVMGLLATKIAPLEVKQKTEVLQNLLLKMFQQRDSPKFRVSGLGLLWHRDADGNYSVFRSPRQRATRAASNLLQSELDIRPDGNENKWSEWKLWDGRWWFRFRGHREAVKVRATEERDMSYVHHSILEKARKYPDQPVIQLPPDKNRYALPIILIGFKRVAYPSMGLRLANYEDPDVKGFKWEMKFRGSDRIFDSEITRLPDNGLELL